MTTQITPERINDQRDKVIKQLNDVLKAKLQQQPLATLAQQLGYGNPRKLHKHLYEHILDQRFLGLDTGHFDYKYGTRALLIALVEPLALDRDLLEQVFTRVDEGINLYNTRRPSLSVMTDYSREKNYASLIVLMARSRSLRISVAYDDFDTDVNVMRPVLSDIVRDHYQQNEGKLEFWGNIKGYEYVHYDGSKHFFTGDGEVKNDAPIGGSSVAVGYRL